MKIERINPADLHTTPGYHHVTLVTAARMAFLAGQCPLLEDGTVVGADRSPDESDLDVAVAQADQIAANTSVVLATIPDPSR